MKLCDEDRALFRNRVKLELELIKNKSGRVDDFMTKSDEVFFKMFIVNFRYFFQICDEKELFCLRCIFADEVNKFVLFKIKQNKLRPGKRDNKSFNKCSQNYIWSPETILYIMQEKGGKYRQQEVDESIPSRWDFDKEDYVATSKKCLKKMKGKK